MTCLVIYRDGLDAATALGASPSRSVEQEAAELSLHAGCHLTPLTAPDDTGWEGRRKMCCKEIT